MTEKKDLRFVRARNGTVFRRTEMNQKSQTMVDISDFEALKFFLDEGYDKEQLRQLGLDEQYEMYLAQKENRKSTRKTTTKAED
jgi:hypothetical protein